MGKDLHHHFRIERILTVEKSTDEQLRRKKRIIETIVLCYFGRRGAGALWTKLLSNEAKALDIPRILFLARDNDEISQGLIRYTIDVPHNFLSFTRLPIFLVKSFSALRKIQLMKEEITVIFPMPSPLDLIPRVFFRLANKRTISIIHDPIKHSGEIFPFKLYTYLVGKLSSELVFLSNFAKTQFIKNFLSGSKIKSKVIGHPPLLMGEVSQLPEEEQGYYLCLGRLVKYKGIENLMKVFPEVDLNDKTKLIVIGSGSSINIPDSKQIEIHNKWMTNEQFLKMIANSGIVLLPYIEATQSGIIPIIQMLKKPYIYSEVGGLVEQSIGYSLAVGIRGAWTPSNLKEAINKISEQDPRFILDNPDFSELTLPKILS